MKISFYDKNESLLENLKEIPMFTEVQLCTNREQIDGEVIIISDNLVPHLKLDEFNTYKRVFYILDSIYEPGLLKAVKALCDSQDIILVPQGLTNVQIADFIKETLFPTSDKSNSNVITFFSALSNVGTSSTTLSVGQAFTEHTNAKVGIICLDAWDDGVSQLNYKGSYLNEIKNKLSSKQFNLDDDKGQNEFLTHFYMKEKDRFYILGGNQSVKMQRLFTEEEMSYLIELSRKMFDIVLIDGGSHFDNACMFQALFEGDLKFMVMNQQQKGLRKYKKLYEEILYPLGLNHSDFMLLINEYRHGGGGLSPKEIAKESQVPLFTAIEYIPDFLQSEENQMLLYNMEESGYRESIELVLKAIAGKMNIEVDLIKKKKFLGIF